MDRMPDEIILYIFRYFDIRSLQTLLSKVSTRWKELTKVSCLYNHLTLRKITDVSFLESFIERRYITSIEVKHEIDLINSFLEQLAVLCPRLRSLTINRCNLLSERHILRLFRCFPDLKYINVFLLCHFVSQTFLDCIKNVNVLVLNNHIDNTALKTIAKECANLTELHMYGSIQYYPLCQLHTLFVLKFDRLKRITLRCCEVNNRTCDLIVKCKHLKHLHLFHCWLITDVGLLKIASMKSLRSIHITGLKLISQKGFDNFIKELDMESLQDLNLSSTPFNDNTAKCMCKKKQYLKRLELWQCKKLSEDGIKSLIGGLKLLMTLDIDMELSEDTISEIIYNTNIRYLRYSKYKEVKFNFASERFLITSDAFGHYNELYFRGNNEGYSANLTCYNRNTDNLEITDINQESNIKR